MVGQPDRGGGDSRSDIVREKQKAAGRSVLAGLFLTVIKLLAGLVSSSLGLLAEAAHSALDCGAALVTWFAVRSSWKPPDLHHHYGHGKIENLAALIETMLLALTSLWIIIEAVERMSGAGPEVKPSLWAFGAIGISMVVDVARSRDLMRVARKSRSQALEADALHFSTDIASSAVVILGLAGVLVSRKMQMPWLAAADSIAAVLVALIVLVLGYRLGRKAVDVLLDRAPDGVSTDIISALAGLDRLERTPMVRVRQGGDRTFVDVDLFVRPGLPIAEGEKIAMQARSEITTIVDGEASVLVQLRTSGEKSVKVRDKVSDSVAAEGLQAHEITVRSGSAGLHADLHLELSSDMTLDEAHKIADKVENRILLDVPELDRVDIHLDIQDAKPSGLEPLDPVSRDRLERRIHSIARQVTNGYSVHDLMLIRSGEGLYLSCHCTLPGSTGLDEAHEITVKLEDAFRKEFPELDRVAVHAEPTDQDSTSSRST